MNAPLKAILGTATELAHWRKQVERALRGQTIGFESVADAVDEGRMFMFDNGAAFVVVEPQGEGDDMQLMIVVGGGSQVGLEALEFIVRIWGRMIGAKKMVAQARKGFWPRVKRQGWKMPRVIIEKEI